MHYYPQESVNGDNNGGVDSNNVDQATALLRNQVTRSLWDPSYVDPSWIASTGINGGKVDLIPMMRNWVNTYYPGTKVGVTEYNFGAEGDMNGATTQADVYGIFGQQGLDLATRWTTPAAGTPTYLAMKLWRNYDGQDSGFGDTSVSASVANPDQTDAFAAVRSSDGALTVAVINKNLYDSNDPSATTSVTINLSGFSGNGVAQEWQLAAVNPSDQTIAAITHLSDVTFSGNSFTLNVPMESVTMFTIEPAGAQTQAPKVTTNPTSEAILAGQSASFTAAATGAPSPTVQWQMSTNGGNSFTNIAGATATTYAFTAAAGQNSDQFRAVFTNSAGSATTDPAMLTVDAAPGFTSAGSANFTLGTNDSFTVTATGVPTPSLTESGALPTGVTFGDNSNGSATLSGTPATGTAGIYTITLTASNGASPNATQKFSLMVSQVSTGQLSGVVFRDTNLNGVQDSGEPGLVSQVVFLDLNNNGILDPGEPSTTTDATGAYTFSGLAPGTCIVRQNLMGGVLLSNPASGSYQATVTAGTSITGDNFADVFSSIAVPLTLPPSTPFPAQGNANADYVEGVYRAVLDRNADAAGLSWWTGVLNSNPQTRLQVVQGIRNSPEHFGQEIDAFFETLLGRAADAQGRAYWVSQLENGEQEEQIAFGFLNSAEYLSNGDKYFVDAMYQSLLGRPFDAAGEASWLNELGDDASGNPTHPAALTHTEVVNSFLYSTESLDRLVEGYYEVFLQRQADPTGLNSWVAGLQQGLPFLTIGQEFLASDEFFAGAAGNG